VAATDIKQNVTEAMSEFLCVGDIVSLYCEETEGYVYNCQTR